MQDINLPGDCSQRIYNVLFLCTGNSARSILAEALLQRKGQGRFKSFSVGSSPKGKVHPMAIELLKEEGYSTENFRSKCWDEFESSDTPKMDVVVTVCDSAADEVCPIWPGNPVKTHWSIPDPAAVNGPDSLRLQAFRDAYAMLKPKIERLAELMSSQIEPETFQKKLDWSG